MQKSNHPTTPALQDESFEFLWNVFTNINEWIKFSDAKAAGIFVVNGTIMTLVITSPEIRSLTTRTPVATLLLLIGCGALIVSTFYALACLLPMLTLHKKLNQPISHIFYGHIAKGFNSAAEFQKSILEVLDQPGNAQSQIIHQIWSNSKVASSKYAKVRTATYALFVCIVCAALYLVLAVLFWLGVLQ